MIVEHVAADNLATLLLLDKSMEETPEPIRMQPSLALLIPFQGFIDFVNVYLDKRDYLACRTKDLKDAASIGVSDKASREFLLRAFYGAVSRAVVKELHYAEARNRDGTTIIHYFPSTAIPLWSKGKISTLYNTQCGGKGYDLRKDMNNRGFFLPNEFRRNNFSLWEYAVVLYAASVEGWQEWGYNPNR